MLNKANALKGYTLDGIDGEIGKVKKFYFDDSSWEMICSGVCFLPFMRFSSAQRAAKDSHITWYQFRGADHERGVAICGSGVEASIAANKVSGVRAGLIHDPFSAHQGVEDDNMNVFCLGGNVIGSSLAWELLETFLTAHFSEAPRHRRRVAKVHALENQKVGS